MEIGRGTVEERHRGERQEEDSMQGACAAESQPEGKPEVKKVKPDFITLMLERVIDTILLEEVMTVGLNMNQYKGILVEGIAEEQPGDEAHLSNLVDAFRAGWKVYRVEQDKKAAMDAVMEAMNNELWVSEST